MEEGRREKQIRRVGGELWDLLEMGPQPPAPLVAYASRIVDTGDERLSLWSFPAGLIGTHESVKGYAVEATDGAAGSVSWASYAPGESYLIVTFRRHLHETHHVIPAGAVATIEVPQRKVWLKLTRADVERSPEHHDPAAPIDAAAVDALAGLWPTWLAGSGS